MKTKKKTRWDLWRLRLHTSGHSKFPWTARYFIQSTIVDWNHSVLSESHSQLAKDLRWRPLMSTNFGKRSQQRISANNGMLLHLQQLCENWPYRTSFLCLVAQNPARPSHPNNYLWLFYGSIGAHFVTGISSILDVGLYIQYSSVAIRRAIIRERHDLLLVNHDLVECLAGLSSARGSCIILPGMATLPSLELAPAYLEDPPVSLVM